MTLRPPAGIARDGISSANTWPRRVAVVGGGYMGSGIAQLLCLAGVRVAVADATPERARASREAALLLVSGYAEAGLMPHDASERVADNWVAAESLSEAADRADLVVEAVTEDPAVKHAVFAELEPQVSRDCVLASNTSAIPIRDLAAGLAHPQRFVGMHFFNPAQWVPCVEVIPSPATEPAVLDRVHQLLRVLGKQPVTVGDAAGFVGNRIQFAMFKEAAACVEEGLATPEQVDAVVRSSFGFRLPFYGPFAIAEMAGLDVYAAAYASLAKSFGPRFSAPASLSEHVAAGRLGAKTGGAYLTPDTGRESRRDRAYHALARLLSDLGAGKQ